MTRLQTRFRAKRPAAFLLSTTVALAILILASCGPGKEGNNLAEIEVEISGQAEGAPEGCSTDDVTGRLQALFTAIGDGDRGLVSQYFGSDDELGGSNFERYCLASPEQPNPITDLTRLAAYFERRFEENERLRLKSIQFTGWESERGLVHFGPIVVERLADDTGNEWLSASGNGAYSCRQQTFISLCLSLAE